MQPSQQTKKTTANEGQLPNPNLEQQNLASGANQIILGGGAGKAPDLSNSLERVNRQSLPTTSRYVIQQPVASPRGDMTKVQEGEDGIIIQSKEEQKEESYPIIMDKREASLSPRNKQISLDHRQNTIMIEHAVDANSIYLQCPSPVQEDQSIKPECNPLIYVESYHPVYENDLNQEEQEGYIQHPGFEIEDGQSDESNQEEYKSEELSSSGSEPYQPQPIQDVLVQPENRIEMLLNEMRSEDSIELQNLQQSQQPASIAQNPIVSPQQIQEYFEAREGMSTDHMIEEFMVYFQHLIRSEKTNLKEERFKLSTEQQRFKLEHQSLQDELQMQKQHWEEQRQQVQKMFQPPGSIIDLDIGGTHKITTTRSTLCAAKDSTLAAMFSGRHELSLHNGRVFLDRDGETFCQVIQFLRNGKIPIFTKKYKENVFYEELDYWQIPLDLNCGQNEGGIEQVFDVNWCAPTLDLSADYRSLRKNETNHGIVFCKYPLDLFNPYVEFKIQIDTVLKGKSHLFIGLVDKSKYRPEFLISTFWRDAPLSLYWDVWSTKLIETDERGQQIGGGVGYGCQCEEAVTRLGMMYDAKNRTLAYYKNGVCQGVAFKNVLPGFYPSLDVWFQEGDISIMPDKSPQPLQTFQPHVAQQSRPVQPAGADFNIRNNY